MSIDCKNCRHYYFYKMITGGPYSYAGDIPCEHCSRFSVIQDNFDPVSSQPVIEADAEKPAMMKCLNCGGFHVEDICPQCKNRTA